MPRFWRLIFNEQYALLLFAVRKCVLVSRSWRWQIVLSRKGVVKNFIKVKIKCWFVFRLSSGFFSTCIIVTLLKFKYWLDLLMCGWAIFWDIKFFIVNLGYWKEPLQFCRYYQDRTSSRAQSEPDLRVDAAGRLYGTFSLFVYKPNRIPQNRNLCLFLFL